MKTIIFFLFLCIHALNAESNKPDSLLSNECLENTIETRMDSIAISDKNTQLRTRTHFFDKIKITSLAYGGTGVVVTSVNNQVGVMTGGRGSATFNNRYTFGGAGWGMPVGIEIEPGKTDTFEFFKFGYGGLEFGYLFFAGEKVRIGSNILFACGAGFHETIPKSKNGAFNMFPVIEPSLYTQLTLGKLFRLEVGVTYRYITGSKFSFINDQQLSGPSFYIAFLAGTCNCD